MQGHIKGLNLMDLNVMGGSSLTSLNKDCVLSHVRLCGPMDCSPLSSSARILEWGAISCSRGSSQPRDQTHVSCNGRCILYHQGSLYLKAASNNVLPWAARRGSDSSELHRHPQSCLILSGSSRTRETTSNSKSQVQLGRAF